MQGLDSLRIAEFTHDLKSELEALGYDDLSETIDLRIVSKIVVSDFMEILRELAAATPMAKLRFKRKLLNLQSEHRDQENHLMRSDAQLRFDPADLLAKTSPLESQ